MLIVSHDRHMLEMTADRLVLVDAGTAREFDGTLDDYIAFVLAGDAEPKTKAPKKDKRAEAERRAAEQALRKRAQEAEKVVAKLSAERSAIDRALFDPSAADPALAKLANGELMQRRGALEKKIEAAEADWLRAEEALAA